MEKSLGLKCMAATMVAGIAFVVSSVTGTSPLLSSEQSSKIRGGFYLDSVDFPQVDEYCVSLGSCQEDKCGWHGTSDCNGATDTDKNTSVSDEGCAAGPGSAGWVCYEFGGTEICSELKGTCSWLRISIDPEAYICATLPASGFPTAPGLCGAIEPL